MRTQDWSWFVEDIGKPQRSALETAQPKVPPAGGDKLFYVLSKTEANLNDLLRALTKLQGALTDYESAVETRRNVAPAKTGPAKAGPPKLRVIKGGKA
jgi:hypothetical protein